MQARPRRATSPKGGQAHPTPSAIVLLSDGARHHGQGPDGRRRGERRRRASRSTPSRSAPRTARSRAPSGPAQRPARPRGDGRRGEGVGRPVVQRRTTATSSARSTSASGRRSAPRRRSARSPSRSPPPEPGSSSRWPSSARCAASPACPDHGRALARSPRRPRGLVGLGSRAVRPDLPRLAVPQVPHVVEHRFDPRIARPQPRARSDGHDDVLADRERNPQERGCSRRTRRRGQPTAVSCRPSGTASGPAIRCACARRSSDRRHRGRSRRSARRTPRRRRDGPPRRCPWASPAKYPVWAAPHEEGRLGR